MTLKQSMNSVRGGQRLNVWKVEILCYFCVKMNSCNGYDTERQRTQTLQ